jgi:polyhydroxybutyrate depolymerase
MNDFPKIGTAVVLFLAISTTARSAEPETMTWNVNGVDRQALVYAPTTVTKHLGSPLVFAFHGHGGTMKTASIGMHYQTVWPEAIIVYMQGVNTRSKIDPEGKRSGWQHGPGELGDRDLKFFDAVLASLHKKFAVDDNRIYATGFSNGGAFTYLLWAERSKKLAAVAPCSSLPWVTVKLSVPKPVFISSGEADPLVKIKDQQANIEKIRELNGATAASQSRDDGTTLYRSDKETPVRTLIHPGGHILPPNAPKLIVEFFKAHELKK